MRRGWAAKNGECLASPPRSSQRPRPYWPLYALPLDPTHTGIFTSFITSAFFPFYLCCFDQVRTGWHQPAGDQKPSSRMWNKRPHASLFTFPGLQDPRLDNAHSLWNKYQKCKHLHTYSLQSTQFQALEDRVLLWMALKCNARLLWLFSHCLC